MKLTSILLGQVLRLLKVSSPIGGVYFPNVIAGFRERYGFLELPSRPVSDEDASKGVMFKHGKFAAKDREIVIDSLGIYSDGIVVNTKGYVEDADQFADDVIQWATKTFGYKIMSDPPMQHAYASHVEVEFTGSLPPIFEELAVLNKRITAALTRYGKTPPSYELGGFSLLCDTTKAVPPIPGEFSFARRAQQSFQSNLYFSTAPLKTLDHLKVLDELAKILAKK
jgi:hypothetical protein